MEKIEIHTFKNNKQVGIIDVAKNWTAQDVARIFQAMRELGYECRVKRFNGCLKGKV